MKKILVLYFVFFLLSSLKAQVFYGGVKSYGLRKLTPTYTNSAIQVRRTCDNATLNIGFTSCGDIDTATLKTFVLVPNPLSAITASAAAAFGLRRLTCSYSGALIQVRRSNDNATQDIGFTAYGDLDTASLKTFVGANNAFVTIWYDQSGNGLNATQASNAAQPRIVNAGIIERQNNMPAIRWLGLTSALRTTSTTAFPSAACFNGVARVSTNLTYNCIVNKCQNNFPAPLDFYNSSIVVGNGAGSHVFLGYGATFNASQPLGIWTYQAASGGTIAAYYNSALTATGTVGAYANPNQPLALGCRFDGVTGLNGWISEVVTFSTIPSATDRQYLEWSQSQYYGISGPTISSLPSNIHSAYVVTWYDQSGNSINASQSTVANQPIIVLSGMITRKNNWPAITFNGSSQFLTATTNTIAFNTTVGGALNTLASNNGAGSWQGIAQQGRNSSPWWGIWGSNTARWTGGFNASPGNMISAINSSVYATASIIQETSASTNVYVNGVQTNSSTSTANRSNSQLFYIGYGAVGTEYWNGIVSEVNVFPFTLNNTRRILFETNQAAYHNITVTGSKFSPPSSTLYNRFVLGVGRESSSDSVSGTRSTVGMGFIIGTTSSDFLKDNGDYITAGINCPISPASTTLNVPATVLARWLNDWYVNKTDVNNNNGTINFYFDFSDNGISSLPGAAVNYELLYRHSTSSNFTIVPGTTKSVSGDRVFFEVDASNIITNYYYTIGTKNIMVSPLPVELMSFQANPCENNVCLEWVTATEKNNDYFTVERSVDATNWEEVKRVYAFGNSNDVKSYSTKDYYPYPGLSYYRLRQTDFNKNTSLSQTEAVYFKNNLPLVLFPNPTTGNLTITGCKAYDKLFVMDILGRMVYNENITSNQIEIDLTDFNEGEYFITITNSASGNKITTKIIKQKK